MYYFRDSLLASVINYTLLILVLLLFIFGPIAPIMLQQIIGVFVFVSEFINVS